jgi:hypothetical protein
LTSSFRKDAPGPDPEFDVQREEFEQLLGKVSRLHKRVVRYNKTFSGTPLHTRVIGTTGVQCN